MKILFFGDIIGKIGRAALRQELPKIKTEYQPDLILANGENLAHGAGITKNTLTEMREIGVDYFTGGNHIFDKIEAADLLAEKNTPVIRPANYLKTMPGEGYKIIKINKAKILLINLMGLVFTSDEFDSPFKKLDEILKATQIEKFAAIIIDFHAEATSEKTALGWYANGRVSAVLGTHTHIATADQRILNKGTAYVTDVGMVGAEESIIGEEIENTLKPFLIGTTHRSLIPETGPIIINAVLVDIDPATKQATKIKRVDVRSTISG